MWESKRKQIVKAHIQKKKKKETSSRREKKTRKRDTNKQTKHKHKENETSLNEVIIPKHFNIQQQQQKMIPKEET